MDVSIIIINFKTPKMTLECVQSVIDKTKEIDYEIIVVDNGSGDNSTEILRRQSKIGFTFVESKLNLGFGKANNLGNQVAKGRNIFLLNSDTLLKNNAVKILSEYLDTHSNVGVCGGNLYSRENKPSGSYCLKFDDPREDRKNAGWIQIIRSITKRRKIDRILDETEQIYQRQKDHFNFTKKPMEVAYIYGADMMLPKQLFDRMNGFDPDFFMYAEEEELTRRISDKGYKVMSVPDAEIIHFDGGTLKQGDFFNKNQFLMRQQGRKIYYIKSFGEKGYQSYLESKKKQLHRELTIAKLFQRPLLMQAAEQQLKCFEKLS